MINDTKMVGVAITIKNAIAIICFIILAFLFKTWWIALFAVLFQSSWSQTYSNSNDSNISEEPK